MKITSAHLSGASYKAMREGGLKYLRPGLPRRYCISSFHLNHVEWICRWNEMHISPEFASKQKRIVELYGKMGIMTTCSCTPYVGPNVPKLGDHVAWSESSALSYVNSFIGARTNREGGPGALAAAILGRTANYGLHLDDNRIPDVVIDSDTDGSVFGYSLLGQAVGSTIGGKIPYFRGLRSMGTEEAKALAAPWQHQFGGHVARQESLEKEIRRIRQGKSPHRKEKLEETYEKLSTAEDVQLIARLPPSYSQEIKVVGILKGRKKKKDAPEIWFCTSAAIRDQCPEEVKILEEFGPVLADTCMVVAPIENTFSRTGTNSAKAGNYLPTLCSQKVICRDLAKILEAVY